MVEKANRINAFQMLQGIHSAFVPEFVSIKTGYSEHLAIYTTVFDLNVSSK